MLKKLQIGVMSFLIIIILLHFKTENFNLIVPIIIAIIINTVIDIYMIIKEKKYKSYKCISGVNLLFAIIWIRILVLYFLKAQKLYSEIRSNYSRDIFISSMVLGILVMVRSYLMSEKFKFPSKFKSKDL
ncbi:hypothetical protein KQI86_05505 [Clostridium sp. MSJ-11]|uniref:Uncharacterized protein n=1 Tax=Clostridium mobile TaxID=2841512 RepID=A0ABS6EF08_9CLOT|nr:hypothetical protein [Clostridium mobile]MBU5483779.1 hypothetical protein [Clostridium mobile]